MPLQKNKTQQTKHYITTGEYVILPEKQHITNICCETTSLKLQHATTFKYVCACGWHHRTITSLLYFPGIPAHRRCLRAVLEEFTGARTKRALQVTVPPTLQGTDFIFRSWQLSKRLAISVLISSFPLRKGATHCHGGHLTASLVLG